MELSEDAIPMSLDVVSPSEEELPYPYGAEDVVGADEISDTIGVVELSEEAIPMAVEDVSPNDE